MRLPNGGGSVIAKRFRRFSTSGQASSTSEAGFSSCHRASIAAIFDGLVVNDIFTVEVSEEELERKQHGREIQAHPEHDARFGGKDPAQQVPCPGRGNANSAGEIGCKQHVREAYPHDRAKQ